MIALLYLKMISVALLCYTRRWRVRNAFSIRLFTFLARNTSISYALRVMFGLRVVHYERPSRRTVCKTPSRGSTSWKLLVLILLCYPTLVAAPHEVTSSGGAGSSLSTAAAASLVIGISGYAHRTRKWTRDESRLEERCQKYGVEYTPPDAHENEQEQSKRRTRLAEECKIQQKERRRSKAAENQKKKRRLETPEETMDRLQRNRDRMQETRAAETPEETAARLQQVRDRYRDTCAAEERAYEEDDVFFHHGKIPFIDVSLEGVKKARSLLTRTAILDDDENTQQRHRAIGCVVCDEFIIGTEEQCNITKDQLLAHRERLGVESYW